MKHKGWLIWFVMVGLVAVALGCAFSSGGSTSEIRIENESDFQACYVLISPSESDAWGEDWLEETEVIEPGANRTFRVEEGAYDVKVMDCDMATLTTAWEIEAGETLRIGGRGLVALLVDNDSDRDVCYMLISPETATEWGEDWLGAKEVLALGEARLFFVKPDVYDVQALDCESEVIDEIYGMDLTTDGYLSLTGLGGFDFDGEMEEGDPFTLTIENFSPRDICYVLISLTAAQSWGEDWLGAGRIIQAGSAEQFLLPGGAHDAMLLACEDEGVLETLWSFVGDTVLTIGGTGLVELSVVNESSEDICRILIEPTDGGAVGDRLGEGEIMPAEEGVRYFYVAPGLYDLWAEDCAEEVIVMEEQAMIEGDLVWTIYDE